MLDLIARLEAASGPDRELDHLIAEATFPLLADYVRKPTRYGWWSDAPKVAGAYSIAPADEYTSSIDAALMLVPEGWLLENISDQAAGTVGAMKAIGAFAEVCDGDRVEKTFGATRAIAVCIAALKARYALASNDRGGE